MRQHQVVRQAVPIFLTTVTFLILTGGLYLWIQVLNLLPFQEKIIPSLRLQDILIGMTIYLKTALDFAIFIGNLMKSNPGVKNRIAIEIGTALGNGLGTFLILLLWNMFREVPILMALMIFIASLVLLRMAEESLEEFLFQKPFIPHLLKTQFTLLLKTISYSNKKTSFLIRFLNISSSLTDIPRMSIKKLLYFSGTIPFILGLDDFAGYIPLFSIVNVFGFATGVFLGHMLLNIALFISPQKTVILVKQNSVLLLGGLAFLGLGMWGLFETIHLLLSLIH